MATRKGINISGHYIVSINDMPFHVCTLYSKNGKVGQTCILYCFLPQRPSDTGFLISGYAELIPMVVSST